MPPNSLIKCGIYVWLLEFSGRLSMPNAFKDRSGIGPFLNSNAT